jgi:hypothetical protein
MPQGAGGKMFFFNFDFTKIESASHKKGFFIRGVFAPLLEGLPP